MFADNARWWMISVSSRTQRDVRVDIVYRDGNRRAVPDLCVPALFPLGQRETFFPNQLDPSERSRLEVSWNDHAGETQTYLVDLGNDGMSDARAWPSETHRDRPVRSGARTVDRR